MLFSLYAPHVKGQGQHVPATDSLQALLAVAQADTARVKLLCALSAEEAHTNAFAGISKAEEALKLSKRTGFIKGTGLADDALGENYLALGDYPRAISNLFAAQQLYEDGHQVSLLASVLNKIGLAYSFQANYPQALSYYSRSLQINQQSGESLAAAKNLTNIGVLYYHLQKFDSTEVYYSAAIDIYRQKGSPKDIALVLGNRGNTYSANHQYDNAIRIDSEALAIYRTTGDRQGIIRNTGNIGLAYQQAALDTAFRATKGSMLDIPKQQKLDIAMTILTAAINSCKEIGYIQAEAAFLAALSTAQEASGQHQAALASYKEYIATDDSLSSLEKNVTMSKLETERELQLKDKQIVIDKLAVEKKRNERLFFIIGLLALAGLLLFILRERRKSEGLLLNILPKKIAQRLKQHEHPIADHFAEASIMFIDMAGFTTFSQSRDPKETVGILNDIFTRFDALAGKYRMEKIKTIGDCYMVVAGIPEARHDHANCAAEMALALQEEMQGYETNDGSPIQFRIGLDCGPVVAGVIGEKKFIYDIWGDAVNTASRMETTGIRGGIHCTTRFKNAVSSKFFFESRGIQEVKGKGEMETWLIHKLTPAQGVA